MRNLFILLLTFSVLLSCKQRTEAEKIVDQAILAHGGEVFEKIKISFDFRNRHYTIFKSQNAFEYTREFIDSIGIVKDILNNEGFTRKINDEIVKLEEERLKAFSNSVNSVAYFAYLPYGLNDPAVFKTYIGETAIDGKNYHLIKVTFSEEGGGEDFDDEFLFWINQDSFLMDYLAYSYHTDGGGVRFRKAINRHKIGGLILQDYENYKPIDETIPVEEMEALYKKGDLELLSEILLEKVEVE
ncbi:hypothetical protein MM236_09565 [Belliella sp. DSM 107340]|uniref:Deoxyribose-phosphate aldolase n=1 Tax=Belliella calami TaxID=2923436 RepID=A0ABS9UNM8_9BACT|nr:DUF6503 family protein [Belliella calami]MCH7398237.1 hypothetical protein [Belliella calami]